jgi:ABC-type sugar transport system substrate-binding protein
MADDIGGRAFDRQGSIDDGAHASENAMSKTVFVLLLGNEAGEPVDLYQSLQRAEAMAEGDAAGIRVEVACAPGYDQFRVLKKRLADASSPVDAVLAEPASSSTLGLILKDLKGRTGLVLLNAWDPLVEESARDWGAGLPLATVSMPHEKIGEIQGAQVSVVVPPNGSVLVVTGPSRSSAAQERLRGLRATARPDIHVHDTEAGQWSEAAGIIAFNSWYGIFKSRDEVIHAIAGQSDDVAMGAHAAAVAVPNAQHAAMFAKARILGVGACPGYGRELVDNGTLHASVVAPPTTGTAIGLLRRFWADGKPPALRSFNTALPYPATSVGAS